MTFTGWLTQLAEELVNTGASRVGSVQIDFGLEDDINPNRVGLVYIVDIPPKATITSASIQFLSDLRLFDPVNLEITRPPTRHFVRWEPTICSIDRARQPKSHGVFLVGSVESRVLIK